MEEFRIERLTKSKTGCHEAEGRKRITVKVIGLSSVLHCLDYYPDSVEVEETKCGI